MANLEDLAQAVIQGDADRVAELDDGVPRVNICQGELVTEGDVVLYHKRLVIRRE